MSPQKGSSPSSPNKLHYLLPSNYSPTRVRREDGSLEVPAVNGSLFHNQSIPRPMPENQLPAPPSPGGDRVSSFHYNLDFSSSAPHTGRQRVLTNLSIVDAFPSSLPSTLPHPLTPGLPSPISSKDSPSVSPLVASSSPPPKQEEEEEVEESNPVTHPPYPFLQEHVDTLQVIEDLETL